MFITQQHREIGKRLDVGRKSLYLQRKYQRHSLLGLLLICACAAVFCTPPLFGFSAYELDVEGPTCLPAWHGDRTTNLTYQVYHLVGTLLIPTVATLLCLRKFNHRVEVIGQRLRNNRRSSSVVRLAMLVSRAHRTSLTLSATTRRSMSTISTTVLRDTHLYVRESLSEDLRLEQSLSYGMAALAICSLLLWLPLHVASMTAVPHGGFRARNVAMVSHVAAIFTSLFSPVFILSFNFAVREALVGACAHGCAGHSVSTVRSVSPIVLEAKQKNMHVTRLGPNEANITGNSNGQAGSNILLTPIEERRSSGIVVSPAEARRGQHLRTTLPDANNMQPQNEEPFVDLPPKKGYKTKNKTRSTHF